MRLSVSQTGLSGLLEIQPTVLTDLRGRFVKIFHREVFQAAGLAMEIAEEYYSVSRRRVLRGLHFQTPPHDHIKVVSCIEGRVLDVAVDLRVGSPDFGRYTRVELSAERANMVYIPPGFAHGFYVLTETAVVLYLVTTVYEPSHDLGIRWDSAGIPWPDPNPVISPRDDCFPRLDEFQSPFRF